MTSKIRRVLCLRIEKTLPLRKGKGAQVTVSRKKGREITFCSITVAF